MRRGRILILLLLIVVVGLGLVYLAFSQSGGGQTPASESPAVPSKQVYYAAQNIAAGTVITQEMVATFSIPQENVAEVMFEAGEEVNLIGQSARFDLDQGTLITSSMVGAGASSLSGPNWAFQIPSGTVAVAIPANRFSTMAYGVDAGAHVNVNVCMTFVDIDPAFQTILPNFTSVMEDLWFDPPEAPPTISISPTTDGEVGRQGRTELDPTFQKPIYVVPSETSQRPRLVCQIVLQDVTVLNLGTFQFASIAAPSASEDPNAPPPAAVEERPDLITLMVTPQDSIAFNYFVYSGAVFQLTLRNPNDNSRIDAQSATLTSILTQYNISLPSKLPYAPTTRLDLLTYPILPNDIQ